MSGGLFILSFLSRPENFLSVRLVNHFDGPVTQNFETLKRSRDVSCQLSVLCSDCIWYGTVFCDGDVVEDLFRWWFKMKCSKGKFSVDSSTWSAVQARKALEAAKEKEKET